MFIIVLGQYVSILIESFQVLLRYRSLLIVLGQHVSILIDSSSGPSKIQILTYCIRATCFDSYRIIFRPF